MRDPKSYTRSILTDLAPQFCRGRLIDVGAGRGKYRNLFRPYIDTYEAVDDLSSPYQYKGESDSRVVNYVADAQKLPFDDKEFDTAICTEVIEHVENPQKVVSEISRILKPGGYLILASGWLAPFHEEPRDYWRFSVDGYKVLGSVAGLDFVTAQSQGGICTTLLYIISRNIELRSPMLIRRVSRKLYFMRQILELLAEKLDGFFPTPDTTGHVVVFRRP